MPEIEPPEMFNKFDSYPNRDELPCDGDELQEKPDFAELHLIYHAPGIVKRYQRFPWLYAGFPEHAVHAYMPPYCSYNKNDPTNTHKNYFIGPKVTF